jgi:hypothetical protein
LTFKNEAPPLDKDKGLLERRGGVEERRAEAGEEVRWENEE